MWEALIPSILSMLKEHFDNIVIRITAWVLSFITCWLFLPESIKSYLMEHPLPGLPNYALVYLFYFTAATVAWQIYLILIDVIVILLKLKKCPESKAVKPQPEVIEADNRQEQQTSS